MELSTTSKVTLNNGIKLPNLGLGVFRSPPGRITKMTVLYALKAGYRHFDTASLYGNEQDVGQAIKESSILREEVFVTTKLWNTDHGYDSTIRACNKSLQKLGFDYIDLYLVHWPVKGPRLETWRAMEALLDDGMVKAIGVSNYMVHHFEELLEYCTITPAVNQIELSPYNFQFREDVVEFCRSEGIQLEAYSPLTKRIKLKDPKLVELATKYAKTPAQILIRWALQQKLIVIPKSTNKDRIYENFNVFDFAISLEDIEYLNSFNEDLITGWDPTNAP